MAKAFWGASLVAVGLAGCAYREPPAHPPIWSVGYGVPFDSMVSCLASSPSGPFTVSTPAIGQGGIVRIPVTSASAPPGTSQFVVYRLPLDGSQVNWRRPRDANGFESLDADARTRANECGNNDFRAM